jgi:hypothetical protein
LTTLGRGSEQDLKGKSVALQGTQVQPIAIDSDSDDNASPDIVITKHIVKREPSDTYERIMQNVAEERSLASSARLGSPSGSRLKARSGAAAIHKTANFLQHRKDAKLASMQPRVCPIYFSCDIILVETSGRRSTTRVPTQAVTGHPNQVRSIT